MCWIPGFYPKGQLCSPRLGAGGRGVGEGAVPSCDPVQESEFSALALPPTCAHSAPSPGMSHHWKSKWACMDGVVGWACLRMARGVIYLPVRFCLIAVTCGQSSFELNAHFLFSKK